MILETGREWRRGRSYEIMKSNTNMAIDFWSGRLGSLNPATLHTKWSSRLHGLVMSLTFDYSKHSSSAALLPARLFICLMQWIFILIYMLPVDRLRG
jgi:hypothetical protein